MIVLRILVTVIQIQYKICIIFSSINIFIGLELKKVIKTKVGAETYKELLKLLKLNFLRGP